MTIASGLFRFVFAALVLEAVFAPASVSAQSAGNAPAVPTGWGSAWAGPANEQQRREMDFLNRCQARYEARDFRGEITLCDQAIQKESEDPILYDVRAQAHAKLEQYDRAMEDENHALSLARRKKSPELTAKYLHDRAILHARLRAYPAALLDLQDAAKLYPDSPVVRNSLAWLRSTAPDAAVRSGRDGVAQARRAVALSGTGETWSVLDTLAAAHAEAGDFAQAVKSEQQAMAAASRELKDRTRAGKFQNEAADRLRLFQQHQPYREEIMPD